jgi:arylsulfatase A-like enzyme
MRRREFLKTLGLGAAAALLPGRLASAEAAAHRPPNIVFVLADDLGYSELGCYGNTFNETPNLDALARQGVRFTDAYAAAPVCSPYRAALMTGQWPGRVGITDYLRPNDAKHLSTDHVTIAEALKRAGYATGMIGKWHLTGYANHGAKEVPPTQHGFDEAIVSENRGIGGGSYFHPYHFNREIEKRLPGREYLVDRVNLEAVEFIQRHAAKAKPFFLFVSHYAVHTRLVGRPDLVAKYEKKRAAMKPAPPRGRNNPHLAAQLESIDQGVGTILKKLEELGIADNTVVIFTSDNGGEGRVTSNAPLRAGKSTLYEGGIREPLIVRGPGVAAGAVCTTPACNVDFYPTLCELAGVRPDAAQKLDGVSITPLLRDPRAALKRDTLYWHYPLARRHFLGGRSGGAIRRGDWKLIEFFDTGQCELYDLAGDPSEKSDLAAARPDKAAELKAALAAWRKEVGAVILPDCKGYDPKRPRPRPRRKPAVKPKPRRSAK